MVAAAAAWTALTLLDLASVRDATVAHHHGLAELGTSAAAWTGEVGWSAVMATAMMAPLVVPNLHRLARTSLWSRVGRSQVLFVAGYVGVWTVAVMLISGAVELLRPSLGTPLMLAIAFAVAVAWQLTSVKRRALRRCARSLPLAPRGWRADRDCLRFGVVTAGSCMVTCWALMAAAAASGHGVAVMAGLFVVQLRERLRPRTSPRWLAVAIGLVGLAVVTWSLTVTS